MNHRRWLIPGGFLALVVGFSAHAAGDSAKPTAITTEGVPDLAPELLRELGRYQHVRSASFHGWSPDGAGVLISTRFGDTTQLHRVFEPGGRRRQETFFDEPVGGRYLPGTGSGPFAGELGPRLLVTMSQGGNENEQILRLDLSPRRTVRLTDGKSRNLLGPIKDDGSAMIVHSNQRNGRDTDLYLVDPEGPGKFEMLMQTAGEYWTALDWSPDGSKLLLLRYVSINESYPAVLDVQTRRRFDFPQPAGKKVAYGAGVFSTDGKSVFLASDAEGEFRTLARIDLDGFMTTWLTKEIPWDVESVAVHSKSGTVLFTANENGASGLYRLEGDVPRKLAVPLGVVENLEISPDGKQIGFTLSQPAAPADVYSLDLANGRLTRWTYSEVGDLDASTFVSPERIFYPSFDGREIPAYYFRTARASAQRPAPVLIHIHGGPESQYRPYFSASDQYLLRELGVAVIRPNVRGSAGYGKTYVALDNGMKREDSVRDIGALLDWIAQQPELDKTRVAVTGGSYGGYMVLASLTHYSDRLRAGVDVVGIASFQTFLANTSPYRQDLRRAEYGDERDPQMQAFYRQIDPLHNADKIRTSLLVAHGVNDPRVPFSEARQIAPRVRAGGREVWTVYASNEGHGFRKKENADYLSAVTIAFLKKFLKGE